MDLLNTIYLILIVGQAWPLPGVGDRYEKETDAALALVHLSAQKVLESSQGSAAIPEPLVCSRVQ